MLPVSYRPPLGDPQALHRPYLWIDVVGPHGRSLPIYGLVDSGADLTALPFGYAVLLGLTAGELLRMKEDVKQVQGKVPAWTPARALTASVRGLPHLPFELTPTFVPGSQLTLWGRLDFFAVWDCLFSEADQIFTITRR